jgi:hypothetical protein
MQGSDFGSLSIESPAWRGRRAPREGFVSKLTPHKGVNVWNGSRLPLILLPSKTIAIRWQSRAEQDLQD